MLTDLYIKPLEQILEQAEGNFMLTKRSWRSNKQGGYENKPVWFAMYFSETVKSLEAFGETPREAIINLYKQLS